MIIEPETVQSRVKRANNYLYAKRYETFVDYHNFSNQCISPVGNNSFANICILLLTKSLTIFANIPKYLKLLFFIGL